MLFAHVSDTPPRGKNFQIHSITKTCLYNFDPLKPHFYIVKLGFRGVYIIFLLLLKNIDCGYSLEPPRRGGSNENPQSMFEQNYEKYQNFLSENFNFWVVKFSVYLNRHVFVMASDDVTAVIMCLLYTLNMHDLQQQAIFYLFHFYFRENKTAKHNIHQVRGAVQRSALNYYI